ncbi:MAG: tetratricopeptide repeat protein [Planctomycetota bacterium]
MPYAYSQRAKAHAAFGKYKEAVRDLEKAVKLSGKGRVDPNLYFRLAALETELGNISKVVRWLKDADPTSEELDEFRRKNPKIEALIRRSGSLRKLFK